MNPPLPALNITFFLSFHLCFIRPITQYCCARFFRRGGVSHATVRHSCLLDIVCRFSFSLHLSASSEGGYLLCRTRREKRELRVMVSVGCRSLSQYMSGKFSVPVSAIATSNEYRRLPLCHVSPNFFLHPNVFFFSAYLGAACCIC